MTTGNPSGREDRKPMHLLYAPLQEFPIIIAYLMINLSNTVKNSVRKSVHT